MQEPFGVQDKPGSCHGDWRAGGILRCRQLDCRTPSHIRKSMGIGRKGLAPVRGAVQALRLVGSGRIRAGYSSAPTWLRKAGMR